MESENYSFLDISTKTKFNIRKQEDFKKVFSVWESFLKGLEKELGEKIVPCGEIFTERFFFMYLFERGGFLMVSFSDPFVIQANFLEKDRKEKFKSFFEKKI